jgi:hypothetical protein
MALVTDWLLWGEWQGWHAGRALLARRAGVWGGPVQCRGESLDRLGHLSADGCMRAWLPSYANLPRRAHRAFQHSVVYTQALLSSVSQASTPQVCVPIRMAAPCRL